MKSLFIVDGNNWFRRRIEVERIGNPLRRCFLELQNRPEDIVMVVWDGKYATKARKVIYPAYKATRRPPMESIFEAQDLLKSALAHSRCLSMEIEGYEADDVIAYLVKRYEPTHDILIESNDADFAQLGVKMTRQEFPIPAGAVTLYKTLVGDPSDNIPGVPGFGKGAWENLDIQEANYLRAALNTGEIDIKYVTNPKILKFLEAGGFETLKTYWKVVNFLPIPEVALSITIGKMDIEKAGKIFSRYEI